jgi:hypothetical protein
MAIPELTPVISPVAEVIVAYGTYTGSSIHVPPAVRSVTIVVVPGHIWFNAVVIADGELLTVIVLVAMQPPAPV